MLATPLYIDICFISETWLNDKIPSSLICPIGYNLLRRDRWNERPGGGVAILCRNDWNIKELDFQNNLECLWCEIQGMTNNKYYTAVIYHPPDPIYAESELLDHLSDSCEQILLSDLSAKIIIAGDINQLNINDLSKHHNLEQLVKKNTRGQRVLDVFLTNSPYLWKSPVVFAGLVRSDHLTVMITPKVLAKPEGKHVYFRDVREHRKIDMENKLKECDWSSVYNTSDVDYAVTVLNELIVSLFNECFPLIRVKVSSRDPLFMSPLVKHLCKIRNRRIRRGIIDESQERINKLIRDNQIRAVYDENSKYKYGTKGWWKTVNKITGRNTHSENISSLIDPDLINEYFQEINTDTQYTAPIPVSIPIGTHIPTVDVANVGKFMTKLKRTASGPDGLPHWLWRDFAKCLAPILTHVMNVSLKQQCVPMLWNLANISPIPKETSLSECNQLRPISLTNVIMRLFEKLVFKLEISSHIDTIIRNDQFAYKRRSNTTTALLTCQHYWLKWLEDEDVNFVRIISFDFSKAFDSVPHDIVCEKLKSTNINPYIINWIINFLMYRRQRVVVDGIVTEFVDINRGVPQGTVIGPFLFSLMVDDIKSLKPQDNLLIKFADDITVSAPVKMGGDTAIVEVNNIDNWAMENRMSLNLSKTWEWL